jgi:hypothetical protein
MFEVDLNSLTFHVEGSTKRRQLRATRIALYLIMPALTAIFIYITVANKCFAFCNENETFSISK